jgi:calcium-dependent protein kinase
VSPWAPPQQQKPLPSIGYDRNFSDIYSLGQPLGAGSFKTVFVGRNKRTGERVAVAVIGKERDGTNVEHNLQRIQKEVDITKRLQVRQETIRLLGTYEDDKNVYMVTEMCDGGSLEQYMKSHGRMPELDAALLITDVLHVLAECNQQKVCYADIKPANILLKRRYPDVQLSRQSNCQDAPPEVKVIDFGCSQLVEEGTKLAKRTGTPLFLPPEMFMRHWGPEADLWSLGMVSYLLLSGKMPFWGGAMGGIPPFMVMQEILGGDIKFDDDVWAGISEDAIDFVGKLLDRDFNTRMTAEQALQHPWLVMAASGEDLEECSLDWDPEDDTYAEYNMMGRPHREDTHAHMMGSSGQHMCDTSQNEAPH